jgi:hypothetical protein
VVSAEVLVIQHYGVALRVESDCRALINQLTTCGIWSDPCELHPDASTPPVATARFAIASTWSYEFDAAQTTLDVRGPIDRFIGLSLGYLRMLSEFARQRRGIVSLHASCVELRGEAFVFFGPAQAGKTTVALEACRRLGARFVANDRVLLSTLATPMVVGGDETINLRLSSLRLQDETLLAAATRGVPGIIGRAVRDTRTAVADRLSFALSDAVELPLAACLHIRLDGATAESEVRCFSPGEDASDLVEELQTLLVETSRYTSGTGVLPLTDQLDIAVDAPVLNLDDDQLVRDRRAFLARLGQDGLVGRAFGSLGAVVDQVDRLRQP